MEREGVMEELARVRNETNNRTSEKLKLLLKAGKQKQKQKSRNDINNTIIKTEEAICERPNDI